MLNMCVNWSGLGEGVVLEFFSTRSCVWCYREPKIRNKLVAAIAIVMHSSKKRPIFEHKTLQGLVIVNCNLRIYTESTQSTHSTQFFTRRCFSNRDPCWDRPIGRGCSSGPCCASGLERDITWNHTESLVESLVDFTHCIHCIYDIICLYDIVTHCPHIVIKTVWIAHQIKSIQKHSKAFKSIIWWESPKHRRQEKSKHEKVELWYLRISQSSKNKGLLKTSVAMCCLSHLVASCRCDVARSVAEVQNPLPAPELSPENWVSTTGRPTWHASDTAEISKRMTHNFHKKLADVRLLCCNMLQYVTCYNML